MVSSLAAMVGSPQRAQLTGDLRQANQRLQELDRMEFFVYETGQTIKARHRPIIIITSNNEKELPDAFLRRCFFHYIKFPDRDTMREIIEVHFPDIQKNLVTKAMEIFYELRDVPGLKKKPSTSELLDWQLRDSAENQLRADSRVLAATAERAGLAQVPLPPYPGSGPLVRVILPDTDLKLGVLMALVGAPLFLHLIYKTRREIL